MGPITAERFLEDVYKPYIGQISKHIFSIVRSREYTHDLAQETFRKALKGLAGFKGNSSLYTWLYRIATNVTNDWLRKQRRGPFNNFVVEFNE